MNFVLTLIIGVFTVSIVAIIGGRFRATREFVRVIIRSLFHDVREWEDWLVAAAFVAFLIGSLWGIGALARLSWESFVATKP